MPRRVNKIVSRLLLVIFLGYYGSITLFSHSHLIAGWKIVHSHPSLPSADGEPERHNHSKDELLLIQMLSEFQIDSISQEVINDCPGSETGLLISFCDENLTFSTSECNISLRAPPASLRA